jgi:hypothetical protein
LFVTPITSMCLLVWLKGRLRPKEIDATKLPYNKLGRPSRPEVFKTRIYQETNRNKSGVYAGLINSPE